MSQLEKDLEVLREIQKDIKGLGYAAADNAITHILEAVEGLKRENKELERLLDEKECWKEARQNAKQVIDLTVENVRLKARLDIERVARKMHDEYEKAAKIVGWKTQKSCQVPFDELPEANKKVMLIVATAICEEKL